MEFPKIVCNFGVLILRTILFWDLHWDPLLRETTIYVDMCIYIYMYMYVCMYVCMYVFVHTSIADYICRAYIRSTRRV